MFLTLVFLQTVASTGVAPAPASGSDEKAIVVVGQRLSETQRSLAACIARGCPPKEEIDASLAHAENQFLAGDYAASSDTLRKAMGRNKRYAKELPIDVSDLMRANARLASLNGQATSARINAIDTLDILKGGLNAEDSRVLMQRLQVGDAFLKDGRIRVASDIYETVAKQARAAGRPVVEGYAMFRTATLYTRLADVLPEYDGRARKAISRIMDTTTPELAPFREAALMLQRRTTDPAQAHDAEKAKLAKIAPDQRAKTAILVYSPTIDLPEAATGLSSRWTIPGDAEAQWVDIAFMVAPDGSVRDVDIVRQSENAGGIWLDLVQKSLSQRLYRPLDMPANGAGLRRIERYSLVYDVTAVIGSRMRVRSSQPHIEMTDLTVDTPTG